MNTHMCKESGVGCIALWWCNVCPWPIYLDAPGQFACSSYWLVLTEQSVCPILLSSHLTTSFVKLFVFYFLLAFHFCLYINFISMTYQSNSLFIYLVSTKNPKIMEWGQGDSWRSQCLEALQGCPMIHKEWKDLMTTQNPNGESKTSNNKHKITYTHIRNKIPDKECNRVQLTSQS